MTAGRVRRFRLGARAASAAGRARELFPFTLSGAALLALSGAAFWFYGVGRLDLILLTAAVLTASLLLVLALATPLAALLVRRRTRGAGAEIPPVLECGVWTRTGMRARAPRWLPFLLLRSEWREPPRVRCELQGPAGDELVYPGRRGVWPGVVRRFTLGDVLGLTAVTWRETAASPLRLLPARATLDRAADLRGLVGGEEISDPRGAPLGDRVDVRKYGHGDSHRMILWKVFARTRRLFVRMPERAVEAAPKVCAYLAANPDDEPAARLARTVLERGLLGQGWRFGADGAEDAEALDAALVSLARSGSAPPGTPSGLGPFLDRAARDGYGACFLFLPASTGPWLEAVRAALADCPLRLHGIVALHGWSAGKRARWRRFLVRPEAARGADPEEALRLLRSLALPGARFTLVDTASGDVLPDPEAYLVKRTGTEEVA